MLLHGLAGFFVGIVVVAFVAWVWDKSQRREPMTLGPDGVYTLHIPPTNTLAILLGVLAVTLFFPIAGFALGWVTLRWGSNKVSVGADGIFLSESGRFIPYAKISRVQPGSEPGRVYLEILGEGSITLPMKVASAGQEAVRAIEDARAAIANHAPADIEEVLARGGRSEREWLDHLEQIAKPGTAGMYRSAQVDGGALVGLLNEDRVRLSARVGAAVLLHLQGDAETRRRLRRKLDRIGASLASPRARTALRRLGKMLNGSDLTKAMAGIEEDEGCNRRRAGSHRLFPRPAAIQQGTQPSVQEPIESVDEELGRSRADHSSARRG
jgi:hypothetical protein